MEHLVSLLKPMKDRIDGLMARLDILSKNHRINDIQTQAGASDFWNDPEAAQKLMQEMSRLKEQVDRWQNLANRINDALELAQLDDESLEADLTKEVDSLSSIVERMAMQALLSGPYDNENAILAIHTGGGGTDSQDWAQMLERMYIYWAKNSGYDVEMIERVTGQQVGLQQSTMSIKGEYASGYLQSEQGVHRLTRANPSVAKRQTLFAKVEVWPDIGDKINVEIDEKDLNIEVKRVKGPPLLSIESFVRVTHLPTGFSISISNEFKGWPNRERAVQILKSRLFEMQRKQEAANSEKDKPVDSNVDNLDLIRSYVLDPYQVVRDHRTGYESDKAYSILDGELHEFMIAYLRWKFDNPGQRQDDAA